MLPPTEVLTRFKSKEEPASYPSGQDTSFKNLTPMPFRFTENALGAVNQRHASPKKPMLPHYSTTAAEVGKLHLSETDLPMRWYGRSGNFTAGWVAPPKTRVSTGLNSSMDHSNVHHRCVTSRGLAMRLSPCTRHVTLASQPTHQGLVYRAPRRTAKTRGGVDTWASPITTWPISTPPRLLARSRAPHKREAALLSLLLPAFGFALSASVLCGHRE